MTTPAPRSEGFGGFAGRPTALSSGHGKLADMAFKVLFTGQSQPQDYGDDDGFEFLEGGVLAIYFGDETTWSEYHPPAKWDRVTADPDHLAGLNTPYPDEDEEEEDEEDDDDDEYDDEDYEDEDYEDLESDDES
jgi:hypothetical protein